MESKSVRNRISHFEKKIDEFKNSSTNLKSKIFY